MFENQNKDLLSKDRLVDSSVSSYFSSFPSDDYLTQCFNENYVINKPMNEVGGDGYWAHTSEDYSFLVVFDCAGHGRFASMMTRYYTKTIREAIIDHQLNSPCDILDFIHESSKSKWGKGDDNLRIGKSVDMGVLILDKKRSVVSYAGARMDFIYVRKNQMKKIKGTKMQVGDLFNLPHEYTTTMWPLRKLKNTKCYLFSDGVTDLFGGPKNKKLKLKGLADALLKTENNTIADEKESMMRFFNHWSGKNEPLDDLLFISLRF